MSREEKFLVCNPDWLFIIKNASHEGCPWLADKVYECDWVAECVTVLIFWSLCTGSFIRSAFAAGRSSTARSEPQPSRVKNNRPRGMNTPVAQNSSKKNFEG